MAVLDVHSNDTLVQKAAQTTTKIALAWLEVYGLCCGITSTFANTCKDRYTSIMRLPKVPLRADRPTSGVLNLIQAIRSQLLKSSSPESFPSRP